MREQVASGHATEGKPFQIQSGGVHRPNAKHLIIIPLFMNLTVAAKPLSILNQVRVRCIANEFNFTFWIELLCFAAT